MCYFVDLLDNFEPFGCKCVFKTKRAARGNVEQFKARVVLKEFINVKQWISMITFHFLLAKPH